MSDKKPTNIYSPFWPVLIVLVAIGIVQAYHFSTTLDERKQMEAAREQVQKVLPNARTINDAVENIGRDLIALSDGKTNEAAKIIAEFNIQLHGAPLPATNAPAK